MIRVTSSSKQNNPPREWHLIKVTPDMIKRNCGVLSRVSLGLSLMRDWCDCNGSTMQYISSGHWFYFEDSTDATLFALTWA